MPKKSPTAAAGRKRTAKKVKVSDLVPRKKVKGGEFALNYAKVEMDYKKRP